MLRILVSALLPFHALYAFWIGIELSSHSTCSSCTLCLTPEYLPSQLSICAKLPASTLTVSLIHPVEGVFFSLSSWNVELDATLFKPSAEV